MVCARYEAEHDARTAQSNKCNRTSCPEYRSRPASKKADANGNHQHSEVQEEAVLQSLHDHHKANIKTEEEKCHADDRDAKWAFHVIERWWFRQSIECYSCWPDDPDQATASVNGTE